MQEQRLWEESEIRLDKRVDVGLCVKPQLLVSVSLVAFISTAVVVAGVSIWASMFALNGAGYDAFSLAVVNQTINNVFVQTRQFNDVPIGAAQVFEEQLRLDMQLANGSGMTSLSDTRSWASMAWAQAKQVSSCFVGYPDGSMFGYRRYAPNMPTLGWVASQAGTEQLNTYQCDYFGNPVALLSVEQNFNATRRPWYVGAVSRGGFYLSPAYDFSGSHSVGITAAIPLFADLQPPTFSLGREPVVAANGPIPAVRTVLGVIGIDLPLINVSFMLRTVHVGSSNRGQLWYFDDSGNFIAASNASIPLSTAAGDLLKMPQVDNALINATMSYLLQQSGVPPDGYAQYGNVATFMNRYVGLAGDYWIMSCTQYRNRDLSLTWYLVVLVPYQDFFGQASYANMVSLLIIFLVILPVLLVAAIMFSIFCLARPMRDLANCMAQITAKFRFSHRTVALSPISEIQSMQQSYDSMEATLKSFAKFTPVHTVRDLLLNKKEAMLGVTASLATMFFSDIEGFTSISERVAHEQLIAALQEYFDAMSELIQQRQGTIGDYIGDAVFAFFNTPIKTERHAFLAVDAAVAQQEALVHLRADWEKRGLPAFKVRMGINTGNVLAGNVGSRTRMKFTLIGDPVNTAARLEGVGKIYGSYLTLSESTYSSPGVREAFVCRPMDLVTVVGKKVPVLIYTVISRRSDATDSELELERASEHMMALYRAGELSECVQLLHQMLPAVPSHDKSVKRLISRCEDVIRNGGPPVDWTGVNAMTEK